MIHHRDSPGKIDHGSRLPVILGYTAIVKIFYEKGCCGKMEIVISTAASVAATIITVLGAIYYLDRKIEANRRDLPGWVRMTLMS